MNDLSRLFLLADKLAEFTGKDATRESDGAKWSELAKNSGLSQAKKSK